MVKNRLRDIIQVLDSTNKILKIAKKGNNSIKGNNIYAKKFVGEHAEAKKAIIFLSQQIDSSNDNAIKTLEEISNTVELFFDPNTSESDRQEAGKKIYSLYKIELELELQKKKKLIAVTNDLFPLELLQSTRIYLEKIGIQAAGAYDSNWYDASAVMIRRLLETLIIECFEAHGIAKKIKNADDNFLYLEGLITKLEAENGGPWNMTRNCRHALPNLKKIGDQSAHSRFFIAKEPDIEKIKNDLRIVIEELLIISKLKE